MIPQPETRRSTVYLDYTRGKFKFEAGGIIAGTRRHRSALLQDRRDIRRPVPGFRVQDPPGRGRFADTLGAHGKITLNLAPFFWYVQGGYRGLVSRRGVDQTMTITGWSLKESGQGNHWACRQDGLLLRRLHDRPQFPGAASRGATVETREIPFPMVSSTRTPEYFPGVPLRNQLVDPFWVRSNRETYGFELLLASTRRPRPSCGLGTTWTEKTPGFAAVLDFVQILPTSQDAAVAINQDLVLFGFQTGAPAKILGTAFLRSVPRTSTTRCVW